MVSVYFSTCSSFPPERSVNIGLIGYQEEFEMFFKRMLENLIAFAGSYMKLHKLFLGELIMAYYIS